MSDQYHIDYSATKSSVTTKYYTKKNGVKVKKVIETKITTYIQMPPEKRTLNVNYPNGYVPLARKDSSSSSDTSNSSDSE